MDQKMGDIKEEMNKGKEQEVAKEKTIIRF